MFHTGYSYMENSRTKKIVVFIYFLIRTISSFFCFFIITNNLSSILKFNLNKHFLSSCFISKSVLNDLYKEYLLNCCDI